MKYIVINNPKAGNKSRRILFEEIKSAFRWSETDDLIMKQTRGKNDAKHIARSYSEKYGENCVIVACGGDGTVHEAAGGLAGTKTPLMILPYGTGNDFAKKIYNTKKPNGDEIAVKFGLNQKKPTYDVKPIDLIDYNGEKCINIMSFGLDTMIETMGRKIAGRFPFLGSQAYNLAVLPCIIHSMHYQINFELECADENGREYTLTKTPADYTLMAVCNGSFYGGGFCPAPDSVLDDGLLDFRIIDPMTVAGAIPLIPKYSSGTLTPETSNIIHGDFVKSGRIWSTDGKGLAGNCDGENFSYSEVKFKVEPQSLLLCLPKE